MAIKFARMGLEWLPVRGVDFILFVRIKIPMPKAPTSISRFIGAISAIGQSIQAEGGLVRAGKSFLILLKNEGIAGIHGKSVEILSRTERTDYQEWIKRYDTLSNRDRKQIRRRMAQWENPPLISVLMPTFNPKIQWLREAIESVRAQLYPNWELCIADDASTDPAVRAYLEKVSSSDSRIKVIFRDENGHISRASNSALTLCTGQWVALMDHDDLLAEHALFNVVDTIDRHPDATLIYSDEDKIAENGFRSDPYFKCDWNPDLFYSHNMICHLGVYRREIVQMIDGFREGLEGSQDYDLALRFIEQIDPATIHHIPRVLYHWRLHPMSTAENPRSKPYAQLAGEKALAAHFLRCEIPADIQSSGLGYRVRYELPSPLPLVSLIIPTRNGLDLLENCIESITGKTTYENYEILVVDNGSDDPGTLTYLNELESTPNCKVLEDHRPFNFGQINNSAVLEAKGEIIGLINNDIEVIEPDWLSEMVSHAIRPGIGAVGAKLLYANGSIQHAGIVLGVGGVGGHAFKHQTSKALGYFNRAMITSSYSAVTAACLLIRKEIYQGVNGFDEENLKIAFNDVDFCIRVREAGYRNIWTPYALIYHHESATRGYEDTPEKQARFNREVRYMMNRWGEKLLNDPAYSPNLTLEHEDFSFAWPPRVERS